MISKVSEIPVTWDFTFQSEYLQPSKMCSVIDEYCFVQGGLDPDPVVIDGPSAYGRFGFSVTNLGDTNADGHEGKITRRYTVPHARQQC